MRGKIKKWGNSMAVRLPAATLKAARLKAEQLVDIREENGRIVIEPARRPKTYDINEMVTHITPENRHEETDWGPPVGKEFW